MANTILFSHLKEPITIFYAEVIGRPHNPVMPRGGIAPKADGIKVVRPPDQWSNESFLLNATGRPIDKVNIRLGKSEWILKAAFVTSYSITEFLETFVLDFSEIRFGTKSGLKAAALRTKLAYIEQDTLGKITV